MLLPCAVVVFLLGGCAREEAPVPGEAPKAAGVGARGRQVRSEDPDRVEARRLLDQALHWMEEEKPEEKKKAFHLVQRSLELSRRAGDPRLEVEALLELGSIWYGDPLSDSAKAEEHWEKALSRARATRYREGEARALRNLGLVLGVEEAREHYREALRIWEELEKADKQADLHYLIGRIELRQGQSVDALSSFETALRFAESAGDDSLAADNWSGMGAVHTSLGRSKEALECYQRALRLAERSGNRIAEAASDTGLGHILRRRGELKSALDHYTKALENPEADRAMVLNHLGALHLDMGEAEKALAYYEKSLALSKASRTQFYIGQVYLTTGKREEALRRFEEAWKLSREEDKPSNSGAALHGVGITRLALGQADRAIEALEKAQPFRHEGGDRLGEAATLLELGKAYQVKGDLGRAEARMKEALAVSVEAEASFVQAAALLSLAKLDRDRGRLDQALEGIERALEILESIRADLPGDRLKSSFFASKRSYYEFYVDLLMRLHARQPRQGYDEQALEASETARMRSLLELLAEGRFQVTRGIDPTLKRAESEITARLSQIQGDLMEELSRASPKEEKIAALQKQRGQAEDERQELELKIRARHPRYAEVRYPTPLTLQEIQKRLDRDMALLEYSLGDEGAYLFLVKREGLKVYPLPSAKVIKDHVLRVRSQVGEPGRLNQYLASARWLYQELVAPVRRDLEGKSILLIAPDGPLHLLSFDVLLTGEVRNPRDPSTFPYLIRDFALVHIPSASVLPLLSKAGSHRGTAQGASRFVAFADPVYGPEEPVKIASVGDVRGVGERASRIGLSQFPRLEGTGEEVRRISRQYGKNEWRVYERREATERNIKNNPLVNRADRLHIAVHGVVNEQRPSLSGLALTREGNDDGLLQVFEIFNLNLQADLIVLSACDTALGKEVKGEGLVGVTRAFLYAGAQSLVVSLWQVRDDTAPDLMVGFYQGLDRDRLGKARALQRAKLALIARGGERSHPYHWAPFIFVGEPK